MTVGNVELVPHAVHWAEDRPAELLLHPLHGRPGASALSGPGLRVRARRAGAVAGRAVVSMVEGTVTRWSHGCFNYVRRARTTTPVVRRAWVQPGLRGLVWPEDPSLLESPALLWEPGQ